MGCTTADSAGGDERVLAREELKECREFTGPFGACGFCRRGQGTAASFGDAIALPP
jgi:hypothetical protein